MQVVSEDAVFDSLNWSGTISFTWIQMGDLHNCPFCQKKGANVLEESLIEGIQKLQATTCGAFENAP